MQERVMARVCQIAADIFNLPVHAITPATSPEVVEGWDSLQHVNLVIALEQAFDVQFLPEEISEMLSVERITRLMAQKLEASP